MRYRRLARDYERTIEHHEAMVCWATVFIMTKRLTRYESGQPLPAPERSPAGRSLADDPWTTGPPGRPHSGEISASRRASR
jgi:hypothetical protein